MVPLCVSQQASTLAHRLLAGGSPMVVWWGATVEVMSAFARLEASGELRAEGWDRALGKLSELRETWVEVAPSERVRALAEALPRRYGLRALDALQLAAALVWCAERPHGRRLVCLDRRLAGAAREAGFTVETG